MDQMGHVSNIRGPPLQGQQGLRLEVSEDHIPLIKGGSECYLSKRWHETRVDQKISFTMDQKIWRRPSPVEAASTAESLAEELADYRHQLLS